MSTGWEQRLAILQRDAEQKFLDPLRTHGWTADISREVEDGDYVLISAKRGQHSHIIGLIYTSATDNSIYKRLAREVEHIFFNGEPYEVASFAYGLDKPVSRAADFYPLLLQWNHDSADGKFSGAAEEEPAASANQAKTRVLLSEAPIEAVWLRLRQLQSVTLAKKMIAERAKRENVTLSDGAIASKAEGVAFTIRNASDYFNAQEVRNVSQRVLNLYYGSLAFAFAEMLASPEGPNTLSEIEDITKQGHGLYTIDGGGNGLEHLVVGIISSGFFPAWTRSVGSEVPNIPQRKPRRYEDLAGLSADSWLTVEQLFARIPEVSDLFNDIFASKPGWVTPVYDQGANKPLSFFGNSEPAARSYILLVDDAARLTREDIATFPGPIGEIASVASDSANRHFRVAIDHPGKNTWWEALRVHHSPFKQSALVLPIFGTVDDYRAICVVLLYALSIIVRYRPSVWRRVQEGDLDHMRVLIEAFLAVVARVLPEQFLEKVTGERVFAKQPGSFF
jgi:hypothetical protein